MRISAIINMRIIIATHITSARGHELSGRVRAHAYYPWRGLALQISFFNNHLVKPWIIASMMHL